MNATLKSGLQIYNSLYRLLDSAVVRHTVPENVQLHVQQPSMYEKPEAAIAVLGSW
jgi:hypothetical protein